MFPAAWNREPAFALNRRFATAFNAALFVGFSLTGMVLFAVMAQPFRYFLFIAVQCGIFAVLLRQLTPSSQGAVRVFLSLEAGGFAIGVIAALLLGRTYAGIGWLFVAGLLVVAGTFARSGLERYVNLRGKESSKYAEMQVGLTAGRAQSMAALGVLFLVRLMLFAIRLVDAMLYYLWAIIATALVRGVRLRNEAASFRCPQQNCDLAFDDPELDCRCGDGTSRTFPRLMRPVAGCCGTCGRAFPGWLSADELLRQKQVSFRYALCRRKCKAARDNKRRVLIIAFSVDAVQRIVVGLSRRRSARPGSEFNAEYASFNFPTAAHVLPLDIAVLRPGAPRLWAGNFDGIVIFPGAQEEIDDVRFAMDRISLPLDPGNWSKLIRQKQRHWLERFFTKPAGDPPEQYGSRILPPIGIACSAPGARKIFPEAISLDAQSDDFFDFIEGKTR